MKILASLLVLIGVLLIVLGINILYAPELLVPIVSAVFIVFGSLILIVSLIAMKMMSVMTSMKSGMMGGFQQFKR